MTDEFDFDFADDFDEPDEDDIVPGDFDFDELNDIDPEEVANNVEGINENADTDATKLFFDTVYDEDDTRYIRISADGWLYLKKILQAAANGPQNFDWDAIYDMEGETDDYDLAQRWGLVRFLDEEALLPKELALDRREILVGSLLVLSAPTLVRLANTRGLTMKEVILAL